MKKIHLILLLAVLLWTCTSWAAESKNTHTFYGKIAGGYVIPFDDFDEETYGLTEWEFDNGYNGLAALGYQCGNWAFELEGSYRKLDADYRETKSTTAQVALSGDVTQLSGMFNIYFIFMPEMDISTYFGAGAGMTDISWNDVTVSGGTPIDDSDTVFTWQAIAGVSFDLADWAALELDYRYVSPEDPDIKDSTGTVGSFGDQQMHIISAGFKFRF